MPSRARRTGALPRRGRGRGAPSTSSRRCPPSTRPRRSRRAPASSSARTCTDCRHLHQMIDLHSHILRGIDDGARTMEDSVEIARAAVADGITAIAGTPHVRDDWPTDAGVMEYRVAELRAELERQGIPLDVRQGGEIAFDWVGKLPTETLKRFGLGGNPRYVLV